MINEIKKNTEINMTKSIDTLKNKINKIHTGRASPKILDNIFIKYYGIVTPLYKISNITIEDSQTLIINLFDNTLKSVVEKAIINSDLDLQPQSINNIIRISLPILTKDRRKNLIKIVRSEIENSRIAIRNIRRHANDKIKMLFKEKKINEDIERSSQKYIQKITNSHIKLLDLILIKKEKELLNF
ncbi:Ribosome-recycling factor [Serratia symbiotica]|nr:Ribosome-recycling factor [Serratia symbiotica]